MLLATEFLANTTTKYITPTSFNAMNFASSLYVPASPLAIGPLIHHLTLMIERAAVHAGNCTLWYQQCAF